MTESTPELRAPQIRDVLAAFDRAEKVVLTTHLNADGDGAGSQAALVALLRDRGKAVRIVNPTPFPDVFRFLLPDPDPVLDVAGEEAAAWCREADLCVVVDTAEVPRIGRVRPLVSSLPTVVIDHHPDGDRPIEGIRLQDVEAAAAGELVLDLVRAVGGPWSRSVVDGLYVALLTDTGGFRHSNATPGAHRAAADLIARGASPDGLHRRVYGTLPLRRLRLLERALATLTQDEEDGRLAWMTVPADAFRDLGCDSSDLEGLTDYPRMLAGVEVAVLFREVNEGVKLSFRSNGGVDVNALARTLGGGGHVRAAGALVPGPLGEARDRVVAQTREHVDAALGATGVGRERER